MHAAGVRYERQLQQNRDSLTTSCVHSPVSAVMSDERPTVKRREQASLRKRRRSMPREVS